MLQRSMSSNCFHKHMQAKIHSVAARRRHSCVQGRARPTARLQLTRAAQGSGKNLLDDLLAMCACAVRAVAASLLTVVAFGIVWATVKVGKMQQLYAVAFKPLVGAGTHVVWCSAPGGRAFALCA